MSLRTALLLLAAIGAFLPAATAVADLKLD